MRSTYGFIDGYYNDRHFGDFKQMNDFRMMDENLC